MKRPAVVAWDLLLAIACRVIQIFLEAQSTASLVAQAVLVEWGASRLGVVWSPIEEGKDKPENPRIAKRIAIGLGIGLALGAAVLAVLVASRGADLAPVPNVSVSVLAIGFLTAALAAWRDELLQHGIVLRALDGSPAVLKILACGLASGGSALGLRDATARSVFVAVLLGVVMGTLWVRDRGAWMACAASTGIRFATRTLFGGGIVIARLAETSWGGGSAGMLAGAGAAIALVPFAMYAIASTARRIG